MSVRTKIRASAAAKLFVKSRITPRWRAEIKTSKIALFFSPYVTGRTARRVLLVAGAGDVELYTAFSALDFAAGASSLDCLQRLVDGGVKVYRLPTVHAKVLLVPGRVVTVGSQNLTNQGKSNREASVSLTDQSIVEQAHEELQEWLRDRQIITQEMIADMRQDLGQVRKLFRRTRESAEALDEQVAQQQKARETIARNLEEERRRQERIRLRRLRLHETLSKIRVASRVVRARVSSVGYRHDSLFGEPFDTLVAQNGRSLTKWRFDDEIVTLRPKYRYLCMIEDTGKLGWARVGSSRITFVQPNVVHGDRLDALGRSWEVTVEGEWATLDQTDYNLIITIKSHRGEEASVKCWFSIDELLVQDVNWKSPLRNETVPSDLARVITKNEEHIRERLIAYLVKSFKFKAGQKLVGARAHEFFGGLGRRYTIRLGKVGGEFILIAKEGWRR